MKKLITLLLAAVMLLTVFTACQTNKADEGAPATNVEENAETNDTEATGDETEEDVPATDGQIVMATNAEFPPYEFMENGEIVGIDADIAREIAKKLNKELVIENVDFDSLIPGVSTGKYDFVMAGLTVTEERMNAVNFTQTYATGVQVIIVKEDSPITSADDLFAEGANTVVGVQMATTGDLYCTWDIEDEGLGTVERYNKGADAVMALNTGKVDCVVIDNEPAKVFVANNPGLKILDTEYVTEDYAAAISKNNPDLTEQIDEALGELIEDGTVDAIIEKYIPAE
ncbi:MAG: transporter substrate-binding domain-containing protein [Clostridia bacterium]|nr:transporter substrate-binding domain-containing protein [Clostridia bacterium]